MALKRNGISGQFVSEQTQLNTSTWTPIPIFDYQGDRTKLSTYDLIDRLFLHGDLTGGTLTHFKFTWAAVTGGLHTDALVDAAIVAGSPFVEFATASFPAVASAGNFKVMLKNLFSVAEIQFWAQGTGILQIMGSANALVSQQ